MKKSVSFLVVMLTLSVSAKDLTGYKYLNFQIDINSKYVEKYVIGAKQLAMKYVIDTPLRCKDAGFTKKDSIAEGVMYGKKRADGAIDVSGEGDFKMYRYARYMNNGKECIETYYFKEDPSFGKRSFLMMNKGN